jgi:hypothetical protein
LVNRAKRERAASADANKKRDGETKAEGRETNRFSIAEHDRRTNKLASYEDKLMAFCVELYDAFVRLDPRSDPSVLSSSERAVAKEEEEEKDERRDSEARHLEEALEHLVSASKLAALRTAVPAKKDGDDDVESDSFPETGRETNLIKLRDDVRKTAAKTSSCCREISRTCKAANAAVKKVASFLDDWERWKVQYASELRIGYDPTLCGGMTKPTMEVLSAQSDSSKLRLCVSRRLSKRKKELAEKLKVEKATRIDGRSPSSTTIELLETVGFAMELSRNEMEEAFCDCADAAVLDEDGMGGSGDYATVSAGLRDQHRRNLERLLSKGFGNGRKEREDNDKNGASRSVRRPPSLSSVRSPFVPPLPSLPPPSKMPDLANWIPPAEEKEDFEAPVLPPLPLEASAAVSPRTNGNDDEDDAGDRYGSHQKREREKENDDDDDDGDAALLSAAFGATRRPSSKASVEWNCYDAPLQEVAWASKTTVRSSSSSTNGK